MELESVTGSRPFLCMADVGGTSRTGMVNGGLDSCRRALSAYWHHASFSVCQLKAIPGRFVHKMTSLHYAEVIRASLLVRLTPQ